MSRKATVFNGFKIEDKIINDFLAAQSEKTRKTYTSNFRRVLEFSKNESGQSMLDNAKAWSRRIMAFNEYLKAQGYSLSTVESATGMLRGFFSFYANTDEKYALRLSRSDKLKLGRKSRNSEDYSFSQDDIRKMSVVANLNEKYVLLGGCSFGLRAEDFQGKLTYGKFRLALEKAQKENISVPIPLGTVNTSKEDVNAWPLISSDALPIISALLDANKKAKDEDLVFTSDSSNLTAIIQNLVYKAGIDTHGQRARFHCLRKYLFDRLVSVSSTTKASQIIGHKVSGEIAAYVGEGSLREVYERAMPSIVVTNGNNGIVKAKVSALEEENKQLRERIAQLEAEKAQNEQNFSKVFARLNALEEIERMKPVKVEVT